MESINGKYIGKYTTDDNRIIIQFEVNSFEDREIIQELRKDCLYRLKTSEVKSKRTLEQNNYMWALLQDITEKENGKLATSDDVFDTYIQCLIEAQSKYYYVAVEEQALDYLKSRVRALKVLNKFKTEKGHDMLQCLVVVGSSSYDRNEMSKLLEVVIERAIQNGINVDEQIDYSG